MHLVRDPDALRVRALALEASAVELERAMAVLAVTLATPGGGGGMVGTSSTLLVAGAGAFVDRLRVSSARLLAAGEHFRATEEAVGALVRAAGEVGAGAVGRLTIALGVATPFGGAVGLLPVLGLLAAGGVAVTAMRNTPQLAAAIRLGVEYADDLALGAVGVPVPPPFRGDERALLDAVHDGAVAGGILATGGLVVTAHDRGVLGGGPPDLAGIVASIPEADDGGPQVSVTSYARVDGSVVRLVSVTGTSNQGFGTSLQPFDHAGNLAAYGRNEGESISAVLLALDAAGVRPGDRIVLAAYSQGALVAQAIAESGRYDVQGFVSVGGPITTSALPSALPVVELQHPADPVVALQGLRAPRDDGSAVVVLDPYAPGRRTRTDGWFDSHELALYRDSAQLLTERGDPAASPVMARIEGVFAGTTMTERHLVTVARERPRFGDGGA